PGRMFGHEAGQRHLVEWVITPARLGQPVGVEQQHLALAQRGGMLVGALSEATFDVCTATLRQGQMLLFYTDGLTEARRGDD
ncbi:hypothetical protein C6A85_14620, partial [Mycobacterium sp. ITM-2017-0098]